MDILNEMTQIGQEK